MSYGTAPPVAWILIVAGGIFIGVPALAIAIAVLLRARRSRTEFARPQVAAARQQARRATWFGLAGLGIGVLVGVALVADGQAGLGALTCGAGYLVGLLIGEFAAQPAPKGQLRSATLRARRPADYAPRWAVIAIAAAIALLLAAMIAFAVAPAISYGPWRPFPGQPFTLPGGTTSWPGLRGMLTGVAFSALTLFLGRAGLSRIAARPQLTDSDEQGPDELLRRQAGRAVAGAVLSLQLLLLAASLLAGSEGLGVPSPAVSGAAYLGNRVMVVAGLLCGAGAIVSWLVLSGWMRRRPAVAPPAGPVLRPEG